MTQQPAPPPQRNLLLFFLLATALLFGYMQFRGLIFPAPKADPEAPGKDPIAVKPGTGSPRVPVRGLPTDPCE